LHLFGLLLGSGGHDGSLSLVFIGYGGIAQVGDFSGDRPERRFRVLCFAMGRRSWHGGSIALAVASLVEGGGFGGG
jgi:hypothetical protein